MQSSQAFIVQFKDLERWNVSFFRIGKWHWPKNTIKPISFFTVPETDSVTLANARESNIPIISKISFSGKLFLRPQEDYDNYKGRLFLVRPDRMIFSKINARRGCILYVPQRQQPFAVSGEYPILRIDENIALGEYVDLALRVGPAREQLFGQAAGMAKARTYLADFQRVEIPLPPLNTQRAIVKQWQAAQEEVAAIEERVEELEKEIDAQFFRDLGLKPPKQNGKTKAFAVSWKDFARWSVGYNQSLQIGANITKGKYAIIGLGSILERLQYGTSEKADSVRTGTPVIRMNNIVNGVLDLANLKYIKFAPNEREKLLLHDGDILFNRTNSKELVGKSAVFHSQGEYIFASYLIRVVLDVTKAFPDYLAHVMNSAIGRQQIDALSRQIIGQANVNTQELRSLQIPLPPLAVQREIVQRVQEGRAQIAREHESAKRKAEEAKAEIEAMILGTRKINP